MIHHGTLGPKVVKAIIMHQYTAKKFDLPDLSGLSPEQVEVHLGLYEGYVKHTNLIRERIKDLEQDAEKNAYVIAGLRRRFPFEFNGMRMHEYYFDQFVGGSTEADGSGTLGNNLSEKYGSWDGFIDHFKTVAGSRGIGWTVLYLDQHEMQPHVTYVGDHELGQLGGCPILLALDMWEHAFMVDYTPAEKKAYIEAFFKNLNWNVVQERFDQSAA